MDYKYCKIEIDNPICNRRFHIAFEERDGAKKGHAKVLCPHCGVTVFEQSDSPVAILAREENLVKAPDGSRPLISACLFLNSPSKNA